MSITKAEPNYNSMGSRLGKKVPFGSDDVPPIFAHSNDRLTQTKNLNINGGIHKWHQFVESRALAYLMMNTQKHLLHTIESDEDTLFGCDPP